jgi:hypothetical protein
MTQRSKGRQMERKQSLIGQPGSHINPRHFHPQTPPPTTGTIVVVVWPSLAVVVVAVEALKVVEVATHSTRALLLPSLAVAQEKYVSQVLEGVAVSWQPGLEKKSGNPEVVCTGQGGRVWGAGPTQPQLGVSVNVSTSSESDGAVCARVIDVTNGAQSVVGVGFGVARFGTR